jgi:hypothetical protein
MTEPRELYVTYLYRGCDVDKIASYYNVRDLQQAFGGIDQKDADVLIKAQAGASQRLACAVFDRFRLRAQRKRRFIPRGNA